MPIDVEFNPLCRFGGGEKMLSNMIRNIDISGIRKIVAAAEEIESRGDKVIHLEIGRPDFDTPSHVKEAAIRAIESGKVHYTPITGIQELKNSIAAKLERENNLKIDPEKEVIVTIGAIQALYLAILGSVNPGEEVLVPNPGWASYKNIIKMGRAVPVEYNLVKPDFDLDIEELESKITSNTKMILLCTPNNPTGTVLSREKLTQVADIAIKHNLLVLSDEPYERIVFDGNEHISIASLPGMFERTLTVNSFSKTYSMTGWRIGYLVGSSTHMSYFQRAHQNMVTCPTSFAQWGAIAALDGSQDCVQEMVREFDRRRKMVVARLNAIPNVTCHSPKGTFYAFPDISYYSKNSEKLAYYLLKEAHVATVQGSAFGTAGEGYLRLSFANSYELIEESVARLEKALISLK